MFHVPCFVLVPCLPHLMCTLESWRPRQATSPQNSASSAVGFRPGTLHLLASTPCLITSQNPPFLKHRSGWHWSRQCVMSLLLGVLNALSWNWPCHHLGCPVLEKRQSAQRNEVACMPAMPRTKCLPSLSVHRAATLPCCLPAAPSADSLKGCP